MTRRPELPRIAAAALSVALRYPEAAIIARRDELAAMAASASSSPSGVALAAFLAWWASVPAGELERTYVETFDLHRRASLYLTWYLHGDRRQRGQEFVRLKHLYESSGQILTGRELPDFLPLMLEFAAMDPGTGTAMLADLRVALELLRAALHEIDSPYALAIDVICLEIPALDQGGSELVRRLAAEGPPGEQVGLEPYGPDEAMPGSVWSDSASSGTTR